MMQSTKNELEYIPLDDHKKYFYSHDIGLIAYLLCLDDHELAGMDKEIKNKVLFIITRSKNTDKEINNFWESKTSIDAQKYFNQIKRLKNQIYSY